MKLTDFALIFVLLCICMFQTVKHRDRRLEEQAFQKTVENHIMDQIAEDSLRNAVSFADLKPVMNPEKLSEEVIREIGCYYQGLPKQEQEYLKTSIRCMIVTEPDGFYLAGREEKKTFSWSEKYLYPDLGETDSEKRVVMITDYVKKNYGIMLLIPEDPKNSLINSIADYQLLLVYETGQHEFQGKSYRKLLLSGAKLQYRLYFSKDGS